jgi:hypothetical protein
MPFFESFTFEDGPTDCPEMLDTIYQSTQHNITETEDLNLMSPLERSGLWLFNIEEVHLTYQWVQLCHQIN